jgi:hypothetical protein
VSSNTAYHPESIITLRLDMTEGTLAFDVDNTPQSVVLRYIMSPMLRRLCLTCVSWRTYWLLPPPF